MAKECGAVVEGARNEFPGDPRLEGLLTHDQAGDVESVGQYLDVLRIR
jgi:hypothetical protein